VFLQQANNLAVPACTVVIALPIQSRPHCSAESNHRELVWCLLSKLKDRYLGTWLVTILFAATLQIPGISMAHQSALIVIVIGGLEEEGALRIQFVMLGFSWYWDNRISQVVLLVQWRLQVSLQL
jgi:hypothetical protein